MHPSYLSTNIEELFANSPESIREMIVGGEVGKTADILSKAHNIPISSQLAFSNIIIFILVGALQPVDVVRGLSDMLGLTEDESYRLAEDLNKTILEKARIRILGKDDTDLVTLKVSEERSKEELRKEILDTTKQNSAIKTPQVNEKVIIKKGTPLGSRSLLLEQLNVLDELPKDEEVESRLKHIQEQIKNLKSKEDHDLSSKITLKEFLFGEKGSEQVPAEARASSYSKAPTHYNVDPYREVVS